MLKNLQNSLQLARLFLLFVVLSILLAAPLHVIAQEEGSGSLARLEVVTYPVSLPVLINNILYTPGPNGNIVVKVPIGSKVTISVIEEEYYSEPGTRFVFTGWNYGSSDKSITVVVNSTMTVVALYEKQYYIEVVSPYGDSIGSGWYKEGTRVNVTVDKVVYIDNGTRAIFDSWNIGERPEASSGNYLYAFEPAKVVASWHLEYKVSLKYNAVEGKPTLIGSGWYREGTTALVQASTSVNITDKEMLVFSGWSVAKGALLLESPSKSKQLIPVNEPVVLVANYDLYYYVDVRSPHGQVDGAGYYKNGSTAMITVVEPESQGTEGVRYVFKQWSGDVKSNQESVLVKITKPLLVVADWKKQYQLSIDSKVPAVKGDGWYDAGSKAKITAPGEVKSRFGVKYVFKGWTGDYKGMERSATLTMDSPKHVVAVWEKSYLGLYSSITGIALIFGFIFVGYKRFLKPRLTEKTEYVEEEN